MFGLNQLELALNTNQKAGSVSVTAVEFSTHKYTRQYHYSCFSCICVCMTILLNLGLYVHHEQSERQCVH